LISSKISPYEDAKAKEAWDQTTSTTKTIEETQDGQGLSRDADGSAKGYSSPAGQGTQVFDSDLEGTVTEYRGIIHNLTGEKKNVTHHLIDNFYAMGIKNINVIYGTIATSGKESNFRLISEGGSYSWSLIKRKGWKTNSDGTIKRFNMAVPNRVLHRLRQQNKAYGYPSESLIQQIVTNPAWWKKLVFRSGLPAGVALFNIAYGYGRANWSEKLTLAKYKVVDQSGNINESLHNAGLAGWKYRGRGSIQTTFEEGYRKMSYAAGKLLGGPAEGEKWKKMVLANPDLVGSDARLATAMSAVQVIKRLSGMEKNYLGGRQAQNELEGIKMGVLAAFGPGNGGRDKGYGWDRAYGNAIKKAKKHLRIKKATTPVA
jgi:predicted chitinase